MPLPSGVTGATLVAKVTKVTSSSPVAVSVSIEPSVDLTHTASGTKLSAMIETLVSGSGQASKILVPYSAQAGFVDSTGAAVSRWYYTATVSYTTASGARAFAPQSKTFILPVGSGGDLENLPPYTPPAASTASTQRGEALGVAPLDASGRVPEANLPARLAEAALNAKVADEAATRIPPLVTTALAADSTAANAAAAAVTAAMSGRDVLEGGSIAADEDIAFAVVGSTGRRTWIESDNAGRPTSRAASLIAEKAADEISIKSGLATTSTDATGLSFAVVDDAGRRTWLEADEAGKPTDRALSMILASVPSGIPTKYKPTVTSGERPISSGPDIVCWGDSMTAGAGGGGTTYPGVLASLSGLTVANRGVGGETSVTITARTGAVPMMVIPSGGSIPASGSVVIDLQPVGGYTPAPLIQGTAGYTTGTLAGVPGTISLSSGVYSFTRTASGSAVTCNRPTPWLAADSDARRGDIAIIWIGQNGPSTARAIDEAKAIITHLTPLDKRYLVIPKPTSTDADDALYFSAFGRRAVLIRKYLVDYGLADAAITPTAQDTTDIANGVVPTSLRSDSVHWTAAGYTILGQQIFNRIKEMGWA